MTSYTADKEKILSRLKRIEGQLRGIQRMVNDEKYCVDILVQISSVLGATQRVGLIILDDHIKGCVRDALSNEDGDSAIQELMDVIQRFVKT
ncbi:MAG: BCR family protein [Candidatus Aquicultor primus]|uniref:BCR family protein n=1 Tax=Candidatus Aquicultor primus TaxID=1797195 RepID=A0A1F2UH78_9ACTN|nr:MAG: BCR family protein [Candidatus Aquicultor primus]HCG99698.1 BCR family protein [Actinomycetota bacterium]